MNCLNNNVAKLCGKIVSAFTYSHEVFGEKFYVVNIETQRTSGVFDIVPVTVSERLIDVSGDYKGGFVGVEGHFRSYNRHEEGKSHLVLSVFAREIKLLEEGINTNQVSLNGYICKEPIYRRTPLEREVADLLIAVSRSYKKSDYIPCICWGRNARYISQFPVGTEVKLSGRMQSREYIKKLEDGTQETRTAYEVSVSRIDVIEESEG